MGNTAKRVAGFVGRYIWSGLCCLYLFTVGWLFARNRGFLYQICAHFRPVPRPVPDAGENAATAKVRTKPPTPEEARQFLASHPSLYWHQRFELAPGVFTPGGNEVNFLCDLCRIPSDLSGKRVLDIGAANGGFSFEMAKRGATVVAIDVPPIDYQFQPPADFLGSKVEYRRLSVYDLDPNDIGCFDIVLFLGVIYHLRHPLLALDKIWGVTKDCCYVESQGLDDALVTPEGVRSLKEFDPSLARLPLIEFHRFDELAGDASNWFSPSVAALQAWLWSVGFEPELLARYPADKPQRCVFRAKKLEGTPEWRRLTAYG